MKDHTAGDPQRDGIIWTDLSNLDIRQRLKEHGIDLGKSIVKKLLFKHGYKKRKIQRRRTLKKVEYRNEQFEKIAKLKQEYMGLKEGTYHFSRWHIMRTINPPIFLN